MVPDKFSRVDMGGIDIVQLQGQVVEGLYDRLVEAILLCRYQILYNWKFDDILIPPTYVQMRVIDDVVQINSYVYVTSDDTIRVYSIEREPILESLNVVENGVYTPEIGVDGFDSVNVDVPGPNLATLEVTSNGTYSPETGVDGFSEVSVEVPDIPPVTEGLSVTENGTYTPPSGVDGFSSVVVNVGGGRAPLHFNSGRYDISTGQVTANANYCYSDLIPITNGNGRWFLDIERNETTPFYIGIGGVAENGTSVAGYIRQYEAYRSYNCTGMGSARYFRIAAKVSSLPNLSVSFMTDKIYITPETCTVYKVTT